MFFMALCVSRFHSFARIKFCGGEEVGFDAFDGGFDEGRLGRTQVPAGSRKRGVVRRGAAVRENFRKFLLQTSDNQAISRRTKLL
jgi:hypothetical protein